MNKYSRQRSDFIGKYKDVLVRKARTLDKKLWASVVSSWLNGFTLDDGKIAQTGRNYAHVSLLGRLYAGFAARDVSKFGQWFVNRLAELSGFSRLYFGVGLQRDERRLYREIYKELFDRIGYDGNGFVRGGFLDDLINDDNPVRKIKAQTFKAISAGKPMSEFRGDLKKLVQGVNRQGVLENHLRTALNDSFAQHDRITQLKFADKLELNYAVYAGGLMDTSRPFCKSRNGKVYHRDQINAWKNLNFKGKNDNYNSFVDLGGYNCTHQLDFISDELAEQLNAKSYS